MTHPLARSDGASPSAVAWWLALLALATGFWLAVSMPSRAQETGSRRLALVIGNSAYESAPLLNPVNDAHAMARVLRDAGFTVLLHTDVNLRQLTLALRDFGDRLKAAGGTGLFYYAGHGVQIKGRNFLIPVRADFAVEDEVAYAALDAQAVLDKMESAGNGTNIVILDACRNNPFVRRTRGGAQGLAQMDAPVGTFVAFATAPGSVAIDNAPGQRNGLYTTHLLEAIARPGSRIEDVFKQVRVAVLRASANLQVPWESSALVGDFYFHPPPSLGATAAQTVDLGEAVDDALWAAVKDSTGSTELFAYLNRFPTGKHAAEARRRLLPQDGAAAVALSRRPGEADVTWGDAGTPRSTASPRRNAFGFTEGDRFRWLVRDLYGSVLTHAYTWRIDRIDDDGEVWVNDGRQRLDPLGQRRGGNDEVHGTWLEYSPPLPVAEAAWRGPRRTGTFTTTVTERDTDQRTRRLVLKGQWQTVPATSTPPRHFQGPVASVLVELSLEGSSERDDGLRRIVQWTHRYWMAPGFLLPLKIETEEREDGLTVRRTMHELIAVDTAVLAESR